MNCVTGPYSQWANREQHVAAILRAMKAPPTSYEEALKRKPSEHAFPFSIVCDELESEAIKQAIKRACETPITVTHIANDEEMRAALIDGLRKSMREKSNG